MLRMLCFCLLMSASLPGWSQEAGRGYLGVSAGFLGHEFNGARVDVDESGESLGIYGGYRLNDRVAVELGYTAAADLGFIEVEPVGGVDLFPDSTDLTLLTGGVIGFLPVGDSRWELFGGGGLALAGGSVNKADPGGGTERVDDEGFWATAGGQLQFTRVALRAGLSLYNLEGSTWTLGVGVHFGF